MINNLIREDLRDLPAYASARVEASGGTLFFNANELPWGTCLSDDDSCFPLNRYPEPQPQALLQILADYYQVAPTQILMTRGADEGIELLIRLFCLPRRDSIIICPPTFAMYAFSATINATDVISIPLTEPTFDVPVAAILAQIQKETKCVFLCSPNNPTGNLLSQEKLLSLCEQLASRALLIVDEAYLEFAGVASLACHISQYPNLVILRTLSKAVGKAATRIGSIIACPAIIQALRHIMAPYPIPMPCVVDALSAFSDSACKRRQIQIKTIRKARDELAIALETLPIVETVWPSDANYLLVQFNCDVMTPCQAKGIILRNMESKLKRKHCVRISIGRADENKYLMQTLSQVAYANN